MVRRLVEQEHVGPLEKQLAYRDSTPFAARKNRDIGIARRQTQCVHRDFEPTVEVPAVRRLDGILNGCLFIENCSHFVGIKRFSELLVDRVEAIEQAPHRGNRCFDVAQNVLRRIELGFLGEIADTDAVRRSRITGEVRVDAGHDLENGALAGSVESQHTDLCARKEGEVDALEDLVVRRIDLPEVLHREDVLITHRFRGLLVD